MYASDFPHWDFDEPEQTLRQLPEEWRHAVRWKNAVELFRLPAAASGMSRREARFTRDVLPQQGGVRVVEVGTHRIGPYRVGDSVYALADRCPHRGAPLCAGAVATPIQVESGELTVGQPDSVVRCPWHKWEFEIATGQCMVNHASPCTAVRGFARRRRRPGQPRCPASLATIAFLADAAREAFLSGLNAILVIAATAAFIGAALSLALNGSQDLHLDLHEEKAVAQEPDAGEEQPALAA